MTSTTSEKRWGLKRKIGDVWWHVLVTDDYDLAASQAKLTPGSVLKRLIGKHAIRQADIEVSRALDLVGGE